MVDESKYKGRERIEGWLHHDGIVSREVGYRCTPMSPDAVYFPRVCFSIHEGMVYKEKAEAIKAAQEWIAEREQELARLKRKLKEV